MKFSDIPGNDEIKESLRAMADSDRIPHALLFAGQPGIGKMMAARAMAQYVHCQERCDGEPCGKCRSCLQHQANENPDLHFVYPVVKKKHDKPLSTDYIDEWKIMLDEEPFMRREKWLDLLDAGNSQPMIYVSEADEISRSASLSSYASRYKIYIVWLPENMNSETANKLLKLLEEPWEDTLFFLVSNQPELLLPTIFSRTQRLNFRPLSPSVVENLLISEKNTDPATARRIASMSDGSFLRAEELLLDTGEQEENGEWFRALMRFAYARKMRDLLNLSEEIAGKGRDRIMRFLSYGGSMIRENFIYNLRYPTLNGMSVSEEQFATRFAPFINHKNVEGLAAEFNNARNDISRNANAKIVLFDTFINITRYIRLQ